MNRALVMTTIHAPTAALQQMREAAEGWSIVVVGDRKAPAGWHLDGTRFLSLDAQREMGKLAAELPEDNYARKNIGYLEAIRGGAKLIAETDDDNHPYPGFLRDLRPSVHAPRAESDGWRNVYLHFTEERIWPRGFPLELITASYDRTHETGPPSDWPCPVQQFLADGDPDVDAIFRLTHQEEVRFRQGSIVLGPGTYCPFNSQNTVWWPEAYSLLYLPSLVSFRMTDIWRSLIAQVCLHATGTNVAFHGPTVHHRRHQHPLLDDFEQEISGYLGNARILEALRSLSLSSQPGDSGCNLRRCYDALVEGGFVPRDELRLLDLWLADLEGAIA